MLLLPGENQLRPSTAVGLPERNLAPQSRTSSHREGNIEEGSKGGAKASKSGKQRRCSRINTVRPHNTHSSLKVSRMSGFHMEGFSGYSVKYSPFFDNKLAVASGANFGLVGNGKLYILDIDQNGRLQESNSFLTQDCLFDTAWNELHENQLVVAQGDGSLRLFDITLQNYPIAVFKEHEREVLSCNWNLVSKNTFVSSSWDGTAKIWSPLRSNSLLTLMPHPMKITEYIDRIDIPLSHQ